MAAAAGVEGMVGELKDVSALLSAQEAAGLQHEDVLDSLFRSWVSRLASLSKISDRAKCQLTTAIREGPWTTDQCKELARIVLEGGATAKKKKERRNNQKCYAFENFIPADMWVKLRDTTKYSYLSRCSLLATVGHSIGIECPDQPTLFRMVEILAYTAGNYEMNQTDVHSYMDKIQGFLKSQPRISGQPYIELYPTVADDLPEAIRKSAYGSSGLPLQVDIPELSSILHGNKMRGRAKAKDPEWLANIPEPFKQQMKTMLKTNNNTMASSHSSHEQPAPPPSMSSGSAPVPSSSALPIAGCLRFRQQATSIPGASEPMHEEPSEPKEKTTPEAPHNDEQENTEEADDLQKMENEMLADLKKARKDRQQDRVLRKPAASDVAAKAATTKKRPAAASSSSPSVSKKPASKRGKQGATLEEVFAKLEGLRASLSRNAFCSRAYSAGVRLAKQKGKSVEDCKAFGRKQLAKASKLYDELA